MKEKLIETLSGEIDRQARQFNEEKNKNEVNKKNDAKAKMLAMFSKAKASSQSGSSAPSSQKGMSPRDAYLKTEPSGNRKSAQQTQENTIIAINKSIDDEKMQSPPKISKRLPATKQGDGNGKTPGRGSSLDDSNSAKRRRSTLTPFGGF